MRKFILLAMLLCNSAFAGFPPTTSKVSSDSNNTVTFNYQFPNFTGTHTGTTVSLGVNSVAGGGTGQSSLTSNNVILGNGASAVQFVAPGTSGNVLTSNGTTWASTAAPAGTQYSWSGNHGANCTWSTTSGSIADPTADATCTFSTLNSQNITVATANVSTNALPGITFTVPATKIYKVCISAAVYLNGTDHGSVLRLTDGTNNILGQFISVGTDSNQNAVNTFSGCAMTSLTAGVDAVIKTQFNAFGGGFTAQLGGQGGSNINSIYWTLEALN